MGRDCDRSYSVFHLIPLHLWAVFEHESSVAGRKCRVVPAVGMRGYITLR